MDIPRIEYEDPEPPQGWPDVKAREESSRALQRRKLGALDVQLDQVYLKNAQFEKHIIDGAHFNANLVSRFRDVGQAQAITPIAGSIHHEEIRGAMLAAHSAWLDDHIIATVEAYVLQQPAALAERSLKGDHPAAVSHAFRSQQRIQAMMGANVQHRHARSKQRFDEMQLFFSKPSFTNL